MDPEVIKQTVNELQQSSLKVTNYMELFFLFSLFLFGFKSFFLIFTEILSLNFLHKFFFLFSPGSLCRRDWERSGKRVRETVVEYISSLFHLSR